jgi:Gas vesicle synthesis protein GvpL/GvpF
MNPTGVYLYGFVPRSAGLDLSGIEGIEGNGPIQALALGISTAVVGEVQIGAFEAALSSGSDGGPDPSWVIPRALRHEAILDAVLVRSPVLPARFGTLFSSSEALEGLANEHQQDIARFFEELGDRLEWSLRGYYDPDRAVDLLLDADPELSKRWRALPESPGTRYFLEKKLREEARRLARQTALQAAEGVRQTLQTISDDVRSLPLRGLESPGRSMILHETFLISPGLAAEALKVVKAASSEQVEGLLTLEPTGPWPPFHFCPELGG